MKSLMKEATVPAEKTVCFLVAWSVYEGIRLFHLCS